MTSDLERQLQASICLVESRKALADASQRMELLRVMLEEMTGALCDQMNENKLLEERLKVAEMKLLRRPKLVVGPNIDGLAFFKKQV